MNNWCMDVACWLSKYSTVCPLKEKTLQYQDQNTMQTAALQAGSGLLRLSERRSQIWSLLHSPTVSVLKTLIARPGNGFTNSLFVSHRYVKRKKTDFLKKWLNFLKTNFGISNISWHLWAECSGTKISRRCKLVGTRQFSTSVILKTNLLYVWTGEYYSSWGFSSCS